MLIASTKACSNAVCVHTLGDVQFSCSNIFGYAEATPTPLNPS